jgi:hypothetical protein
MKPHIKYRKVAKTEVIQPGDMHSFTNGKVLRPMSKPAQQIGKTPGDFNHQRSWWRPEVVGNMNGILRSVEPEQIQDLPLVQVDSVEETSIPLPPADRLKIIREIAMRHRAEGRLFSKLEEEDDNLKLQERIEAALKIMPKDWRNPTQFDIEDEDR